MHTERSPFVGVDRHRLLDELCEEWDSCRADSATRLIVLEGPPGLGKTRLVQELFARLSSRQREPRFWPPRLEAATDGLLSDRGLLFPAQEYPWPANVEPEYAWIAIRCQADDSSEPRFSVRDAESVAAISHGAASRRGSWSRRTVAAVIGLVVLIGTGVTALLGYVGIVGMVALLGLLFAFAGFKDAPRFLVALSRVRAEKRRLNTDTKIYILGTLRDDSRAAEDRLRDFLATLAHRGTPAVVVVDDASSADSVTVDLLRKLLATPSAPVLILATVRSSPFEAQWAQGDRRTFGGLVALSPPPIRRERLAALERAEMLELVTARAPRTDPAIVRALAAHANGNPLVLRAILELPVIDDTLRDGAYRLEDPAAVIEQLPRDYQGVFNRYWEELPVDVRKLMAVAALQGPVVEPQSLVAVASVVLGSDAAVLLSQARHPYCWLVQSEEGLDRFADRALLERAVEQASTVLPETQLRQALTLTIQYLVDARQRKEEWEQLGRGARRVLLAAHVKAANDGVVDADQSAAESALALARIHERRRDSAALGLTDSALRWCDPDAESFIDKARTVAITAHFRFGQPQVAHRLATTQLDYLQEKLGPDHEKTLSTRVSLAACLGGMGKPREARELLEVLLEDMIRVLGRGHRNIDLTRQMLGSFRAIEEGTSHFQMGDVTIMTSDAKEIMEQLYLDQLQALGPRDPETLRTRQHLAIANQMLGRYEEARRMFEELLSEQQRVLPADSPDILSTRSWLADMSVYPQHQDEAYDAYKALLPDQERLLGPEHPDVFKTRYELVNATLRRGRPEEAREMLEDLLSDQVRVFGSDDPKTLSMRGQLASMLLSLDEPRQARELFEDLLADQRRLLGNDDHHTLATRRGLAEAHERLSRPGIAAETLQSLIADQRRVLGPDDPATLSSEGHLASLQAKHPELAAKLSGDSIGAAPEKPSLRAAAGQPVVSAGSGLAGLGISLIEQGRLRAGRVALEKASASGDPLYAPLASFNLGSLLEQEGDDIRALAAYRKAADSGNPLFAPTSTLAMGGLLLKIGDTAAALAAYERAIKSGQAGVACAAAACIGDALLRQGDTLGACEAYERAMQWADAESATELEVTIRALRAELGETQRAQAPEA